MEASITEKVLYLATLSKVKGIGPRSIPSIVKLFPTQQTLLEASPTTLEQHFGQTQSQILHLSLHRWNDLQRQVRESLEQYAEKGVVAISLNDDLYPPLLKLIPDPPPILYAKGNLALLRYPYTVAIIGTREPTEQGLHMARHLANQWAFRNYTVISGLAKGIDTAAHKGALEAEGKTIAVLGTSLEKIYPAENKGLAQRIIDQGGLLLSEIPFGQPGFKTAFVRRDRIQSGLSLCVIPVQTRKDGGTMHTVHFAREQHRYIACPRPLKMEEHAIQYEGIWSLIHKEHVPCFDVSRERNYEILTREFLTLLRLLDGQLQAQEEHVETPCEKEQVVSEQHDNFPPIEKVSRVEEQQCLWSD